MPANEKTSSRNKTMILSAEDKSVLRKKLITLSDLKQNCDITNKTICADMLEVLPYIPNNFADLIIIDPPYNLTKNFGNKIFKAMDTKAYEKYLDTWFHQVCLKLKDTGSLYLCGDYKCTSSLQRAIEKEGLFILNRITWQREKGRGALNNWKNGMEDIWFAVKNPHSYYFNLEAVKIRRSVLAPYKKDGLPKDWQATSNGNFRDTCPSNFWDDISIPFWSMSENTPHPTQKPEKLYAKLILASSKEGDMVFDPFLGSGTGSVVAKKLNRKYCGIEIDEEYAMLSLKRLSEAEKDNSIQGYTDGVFWERNTLQKQNALKKEKK